MHGAVQRVEIELETTVVLVRSRELYGNGGFGSRVLVSAKEGMRIR